MVFDNGEHNTWSRQQVPPTCLLVLSHFKKLLGHFYVLDYLNAQDASSALAGAYTKRFFLITGGF